MLLSSWSIAGAGPLPFPGSSCCRSCQLLSESSRALPFSSISSSFHPSYLSFTCSSKPPANDTIRVDIVTSSDVTGHHHHSMDQAISIDHR